MLQSVPDYGLQYYFPTLSCFFCHDTAHTVIYTLSLHDALPISAARRVGRTLRLHQADAERRGRKRRCRRRPDCHHRSARDRKSTRLNSSHRCISYAVFCLKKKIWELRRGKDAQALSTALAKA